MMRIPFLALILVPITELYLLFAVADMIGGLATLGIVIATAGIGLSILKRQGFNTLQRADQRMRAGQLPGQEIIEGMMLAVAGALLMTPGLITDVVGFLLLTPVIRHRLAARALSKGTGFFVGGFTARSQWGGSSAAGRESGDIIDGEIVERPGDEPRIDRDHDSR
jgi:UPF0716 protein FxsA